jgi:hypothetical protein
MTRAEEKNKETGSPVLFFSLFFLIEEPIQASTGLELFAPSA